MIRLWADTPELRNPMRITFCGRVWPGWLMLRLMSTPSSSARASSVSGMSSSRSYSGGRVAVARNQSART